MTTQVELHRKHDGSWEMRWQLPGDKIESISNASASEVARRILALGRYEFVRGLWMDGE
ncbi:MAG: hypothetical protein NTW87_11590 [Planctomycetota bacterium]|nr:hypothetical protein [Planctomycetota bacterium]